MIINYDRRANATIDEKLQSLIDSIQMALLDVGVSGSSKSSGSSDPEDQFVTDVEVNGSSIVSGGVASIDGVLVEDSNGDASVTRNLDIGGTIDAQIETLSPTITRTSGGTVSGVECYRFGKVVHLKFTVTNATAVSAGSNFFAGSIDTPLPKAYVYGVSYSGQYTISASISPTGALIVRNTNTASVTLSGGATLSFVYITD